MQFMGTTAGAHDNGYEKWYIPLSTGQWNPGTTIGVATSDGSGNRQGALLTYGYGFDNPANGIVMYESGHKVTGSGVGGFFSDPTIANPIFIPNDVSSSEECIITVEIYRYGGPNPLPKKHTFEWLRNRNSP